MGNSEVTVSVTRTFDNEAKAQAFLVQLNQAERGLDKAIKIIGKNGVIYNLEMTADELQMLCALLKNCEEAPYPYTMEQIENLYNNKFVYFGK